MTLYYGGDYNPEQWPESVWDEDIALMRESGVNLVTVGVFSWSMLEPREGEFDFSWFDRVLEKLHAAGIGVDLATATASPPPWLTRAYPDVLPMREDGVRLWPGSRQHYCPSSPDYRRLATRLVERLVARYAHHPAVQLWHVNNEYGCHVSRCYCDTSAAAFRRWLQGKYGSLDALNDAWGTAFWSQRYSTFEEILPPRVAPTFRNPAQLLDFDRFSSGELLECYRMEAAIIRASGTTAPLTTNFLGLTKAIDYWEWADHVDVVSWDSYPDPVAADSHIRAAMAHDLMRSLGGGRPWLLMEQSPSAVSWLDRNAPKAPAQMRALSYQAVARGADGVLFFQWRQAASGAEKFLTGLVPHPGTDTRVWEEVRELGAELAALSGVQGERVAASVAIIFDWESWWSLEQDALPARISYPEEILRWYRSFHERNVVVDFVKPGGDLAGYDLVVAPALFVAGSAVADHLEAYVRDGGTLLVTYQSGVVDETSRLTPGSYLGYLGGMLGVRVEEFAPLGSTSTAIRSSQFGDGTGSIWSEAVRVDDAEVVACFGQGALADSAAITRRALGAGAAWYSATSPDPGTRGTLVEYLLDEVRVAFLPPDASIEVLERGGSRFTINHSDRSRSVEKLVGTVAPSHELAPFEVRITEARSGGAVRLTPLVREPADA